ncbi:MAG: hypothetical protein KIS87_08875 [Phycisphaeraceae bacterium]|nr:hypothetical protein [Phycisphaeraceae bacterium]
MNDNGHPEVLGKIGSDPARRAEVWRAAPGFLLGERVNRQSGRIAIPDVVRRDDRPVLRVVSVGASVPVPGGQTYEPPCGVGDIIAVSQVEQVYDPRLSTETASKDEREAQRLYAVRFGHVVAVITPLEEADRAPSDGAAEGMVPAAG